VSATYRVKHGGLMRCCLASLDDAMLANGCTYAEGDTLGCKYHADPDLKVMVVRYGSWEWIGAEAVHKAASRGGNNGE